MTKRSNSSASCVVRGNPRHESNFVWRIRTGRVRAVTLMLASLLCLAASCEKPAERRTAVPKQLRDVPAVRLAYRFEADAGGYNDPEEKPAAPVEADFNDKRKDEILLRTVTSPDGQRVLALYEPADGTKGEFRLDIYSAGGMFLRKLTPPSLTCVFPRTVSWSPDGNYVSFIAQKAAHPEPTPPALVGIPDSEGAAPTPAPTIAPAFSPVEAFGTEQIYISNRDGFDLRPLTRRDGLIYFSISWAPDSQSIAALACREAEWSARAAEGLMPAGRPRIVSIAGTERLLDDGLAEAPVVWSPDGAKVATAFEYEVGIYDIGSESPTGARIPLRDQIYSSSVAFDEKFSRKEQGSGASSPGSSSVSPSAESSPQADAPVSFNPIVKLYWSAPERLFVQTAYVRWYPPEPVTASFERWHTIHLSPQATLISMFRPPG